MLLKTLGGGFLLPQVSEGPVLSESPPAPLGFRHRAASLTEASHCVEHLRELHWRPLLGRQSSKFL